MKGKGINDVHFQKESQRRKRREQKYGEKTTVFACLMEAQFNNKRTGNVLFRSILCE